MRLTGASMYTFDRIVRGEEPEEARGGITPGKRTLTMSLPGPVQRKVAVGHGDPDEGAIEVAAARGLGAASGPLPHAGAVQASFGRHRVDHIAAHAGDTAAAACADMNAEAYATGDHVVFGGMPTLHTVAHEAAHVIQQRAGVARKGGGGDDHFERHADAVAERVVAGRSAEDLLDELAPPASTAAPATTVQRIIKIRGKNPGEANRALIASNDILRPLHDDVDHIYNFRDNAHLQAVADGNEDEPAGVDLDGVPGSKRGGSPGEDRAKNTNKKRKHSHARGEGDDAAMFDPPYDDDGGAKPEKKEREVKEREVKEREVKEPDGDLGKRSAPMDSSADSSGSASGGLPDGLELLGFSDGPDVMEHEKGLTQLVRRRSFMRSNSTGRLAYVPGDILDEQRAQNIDDMPGVLDVSSSGAPNVINVSVTVTYLGTDGVTHSVSMMVDGHWNSGFEQADERSGPALPPLTADESKLSESKQKAINAKALSKITCERFDEYFKAQPDEPPLKSRPTRVVNGKPFNHHDASLFSHSETQAAIDPGLGDRVAAAIGAALADKQITKIISATTNVDSFPNSVCYSGCRQAIRNIDAVVQEQLTDYATLNGIAMSSRFAGGSRATSTHIFVPKKNPTLREAMGAAPNSLPIVLAGAPRIEALPDGRERKQDDQAYAALNRDTVSATDVMHHERDDFTARVRTWLGGNGSAPVVQALRAAATVDAARDVIARTPQHTVGDLLDAASDGERKLDGGAGPAVLYLLWEILRAEPPPVSISSSSSSGLPDSDTVMTPPS